LHYANEWHVLSVTDAQDFERDMYSDEHVDTNNWPIDFSVELEPPLSNFELDKNLTLEENIVHWSNEVTRDDSGQSLRVHMVVYERAKIKGRL
jgi:hypothetical protein